MATPRSLTGKVVAITGGGRGIGRAIAQALARQGARVAVCDLDREASVEWITSDQGWAVAPCLEAGLELRMDLGAVFLAGDVGPFAPYLPSGAYL